MRTFALCIIAALLLAGCASFEEAYFTDREYGAAQQAAFDTQVAYPDGRYAQQTPDKIEGIISEEVMDVYIESYSEGFESEDIDIMELGVQGEE